MTYTKKNTINKLKEYLLKQEEEELILETEENEQ
jgi:hypothetical protein|tara:strand:- start:158 stop:259 length:102 start_codon:yes stop_codon:yes gene_type:complete